MGRGGGTLGRLGKGSAAAGAGTGSGNVATADDALKAKVKTMEEMDEHRKLARAAERDLKDRLQQELDAAKLSAIQVMDSWRKIMRTLKVEELRHDLEVIAQAHERDVERKDALIQTLLKDLDEAEAQHETALRQHLRSLDRLIDIQDGRLASLEQEFKRELSAVEDEFAAERAQIVTKHRIFRTELLHTIKAVREDEAAKAASAQAEFEQVREALKRRNLERIHVLQSDMDAVIEGLEKKFEEAHLQYLTNTDQRTQDFKVLSERGQHDTQMNERQQRALKRLKKLLQLWRSKMANNVRECEDRNETLEEERNHVASHLDKLKVEMGRSRGIHMNQMKALSTAAQASKQVLTDNTAVAQRILSMAESLRSFESASEKVDPFSATQGTMPSLTVGPGATIIAASRAEAAAATGHQLLSGTFTGAAGASNLVGTLELSPEEVAPGTAEGLEEAESLESFYGRYNKVLVETLALERQRDRLRAEHAELQNVLQQVMDGMAVTPSAVDGHNTLLVVNGRVTTNKPLPVRSVQTSTLKQEAAMITNTYARYDRARAT